MKKWGVHLNWGAWVSSSYRYTCFRILFNMITYDTLITLSMSSALNVRIDQRSLVGLKLFEPRPSSLAKGGAVITVSRAP